MQMVDPLAECCSTSPVAGSRPGRSRSISARCRGPRSGRGPAMGSSVVVPIPHRRSAAATRPGRGARVASHSRSSRTVQRTRGDHRGRSRPGVVGLQSSAGGRSGATTGSGRAGRLGRSTGTARHAGQRARRVSGCAVGCGAGPLAGQSRAAITVAMRKARRASGSNAGIGRPLIGCGVVQATAPVRSSRIE